MHQEGGRVEDFFFNKNSPGEGSWVHIQAIFLNQRKAFPFLINFVMKNDFHSLFGLNMEVTLSLPGRRLESQRRPFAHHPSSRLPAPGKNSILIMTSYRVSQKKRTFRTETASSAAHLLGE